MNRARNKPIARSVLTAKVQLQMHYWPVPNNQEISLERVYHKRWQSNQLSVTCRWQKDMIAITGSEATLKHFNGRNGMKQMNIRVALKYDMRHS